MEKNFVKGIGLALALAGAGCPPSEAHAAERQSLIPIEIDELPRVAERPVNLFDFFKERTRWGVGFDETFDSNVFLKDNDPQEDYISTLEGQVIFLDPRGSVLYGISHEINAFRYHRKDLNAIDHDFRAFFDLDPGGRFQLLSGYKLIASNQLLLGPEEIDILRQNSGFQRVVDHAWEARMEYALNETNALIPQLVYTLHDDQAVNDGDSDRRILTAILDIDHDLRPNWTLFGGYEFGEGVFPTNKLKNSEGHTMRLGSHYEVTDVTDLDLVLKFTHRRWRTDQQSNDFGYQATWKHQLGSRTQVDLRYTDERIPSYTSTRLQFRSTRPSIGVLYELTPLMKVSAGANYEKQRSGGKDVLLGSAASSTVSRRYGLNAGLIWQIREKGHVTLDYSFSRSKSSDYTRHLWVLGFETEL